jgi:8-oxo-dGTP pyrophosphatase MutT (NUDIX family)
VEGVPELTYRVDDRLYYDALSNPVRHDGRAPVTWRVGAYALAERGGRILMVKQGRGVRWELPGGGVEVDEPLAEAAARECMEETGRRFVADPGGPVHADEMFFFKLGSTSYHHSLLFVIRGRASEEPEPGWQPHRVGEVREVAWVDPATLTESATHPRFWAALAKVGLVRPT